MVRLSCVPGLAALVEGSTRISLRLSFSSTKYGPSVRPGRTMQEGVATAPPVAAALAAGGARRGGRAPPPRGAGALAAGVAAAVAALGAVGDAPPSALGAQATRPAA